MVDTAGAARQRGRTRTRLASVLALLLGTVAFFTAGAGAVHDDNLFELGPPFNADILGDGVAANGPDWADLFDSTGQALALPTNGIASAFIEDDSAQKGLTDRTTYSGAGGSNKNNDPISDDDCVAQELSTCDTWHWDGGNVPAKDDLFNVYAYAAINPVNDHLILYAAVERLAPEGDSHVDIEFFQDQVALDELIPCNDPGNDVTPCEFLGIRTPEDIIVSMDYLNGGGIGSVTVRSFDGLEYDQVGIAGGEGCFDAAGGTGGDDICVANNGSSIDGGPWLNIDRSNAEVTNLEPNAFTEFGLDVTALLGGDTPCISTFMPKTRSSQSFTAELKDFAGPAAFNICGAQIAIAGTATNEVGVDHTFTVTLEQKLGNITSPPPVGTLVDVDLTAANGAVVNVITDNCATVGTDANGQCTVIFDSATAGTVTGHATATLDIAGNPVTVETDGIAPNSGDAVKTYVDAAVTIGQSATNSVQENHTFTVTVTKNAGDGNGFVAAAGVFPVVTLTDSDGAINQVSSNTCTNPGTDSNGQCTVTFTSNTAGTVTGQVTVSVSVGGLSLSRSAGSTTPGQGTAVKVFVAGSLSWSKVDNAGNLQGGATFEVCRTHDFDSDTLTFVDITDVCFSVVDDETPPPATPTTTKDQDTDAGEFSLTGLRLGRYTVRETQAPPGFEADPDTETRDLSIATPNASISTSFVNNRPIVKITGFGYTNEPIGTPTAGVVTGRTVFTAQIKNFGGAAASVSGSLTVTANNSQGTLVCTPLSPVAYGPTSLATVASADPDPVITVTTTCDYTGFNDGAVVTATLNTSYTINGLTRTASGSPATISFTVQAD